MPNYKPNMEGLTSFADMPKSVSSAIQSKGGINSGASRRKAKTIRQILQEWGDSEPPTVMRTELEKWGIDCDGKTAIEALFAYMGLKALAKNTNMNDISKFAEMYAKYTDQEPAKKLELAGEVSSKVKYIDPEEYKAVQEHIDKVVGDTNDEPTD